MTLSRRDFLLSSSAAGLGLAAVGTVASATPAPDGKPSVVFAHLTDMHIRPEGAGPEGLVRCLRHAQAHPDNPEFIINGGDAIMSALGATAERTAAQWETYHSIMAAELKLPIHNCIGNHDNWGIQRSRAGTTGEEPLYANKWALKEFGMERGYYTFDAGGWRFIVLDSVRDRGDGGYLPMLNEEQTAWFEKALEDTPSEMPIIIVSHVPILSVTGFFFSDEIVQNYQFRVPGALMQQDYLHLVTQLRRFDNVKLCISGHAHLVDDIVYEGKTYLCNGAVSGSWWHGPHKGCNPGYAIVKLWENGAFAREYVEFEWRS